MKLTIQILFFFSFIYCKTATAQYIPPVTKTVFNSFVENPSIEWAAYANDTATFTALPALLLQKFISGKIAGFLPVENGVPAEDHMQDRPLKEMEDMFVPRDTVIDASGNFAKYDPVSDLAGSFKNSVTEFYQILYVENGRLKSAITRASLKKQVITAMGTDIGLVEAISFCINKKYNAEAHRKDKTILLGKTIQTIYPDSTAEYDKLKSLYGRNLVGSVWPGITKGITRVYRPGTNEEIAASDLTGTVAVPVYDSTGNLVGSRVLAKMPGVSDFKKADITEEYYYDETMNIIICKIPELTLFEYSANGDSGLVPSLRVVF